METVQSNNVKELKLTVPGKPEMTIRTRDWFIDRAPFNIKDMEHPTAIETIINGEVVQRTVVDRDQAEDKVARIFRMEYRKIMFA